MAERDGGLVHILRNLLGDAEQYCELLTVKELVPKCAPHKSLRVRVCGWRRGMVSLKLLLVSF